MLWLKRINFVLIVLTAAFAEGYYLRPLGISWVVASVALTIVVAIAWMGWGEQRSYPGTGQREED